MVRIPEKLYKQIVDKVPILCVDLILTHKDQYILVKRAQFPLKDQWWVIGGRMNKNENLVECARRKALEEAQLVIHNPQIVGIYEDSYPKNAFSGRTHSVSVVFQAEVKNYRPKIDETSSAIGLRSELPRRFVKKTKFI